MTSGADFQSQLFLRGLGYEAVAASASYVTFFIIRMDSLFHVIHLFHNLLQFGLDPCEQIELQPL